jgi:hypothetical protein
MDEVSICYRHGRCLKGAVSELGDLWDIYQRVCYDDADTEGPRSHIGADAHSDSLPSSL